MLGKKGIDVTHLWKFLRHDMTRETFEDDCLSEPGVPIVTKEIVRWGSIVQSTDLPQGSTRSSATKLEEKDTTLAHKLELQEGLPTLYCPPILYRSNSKPCAVRHFDVLVPVSAVRRRGYTTISMLSHLE